VETVETVNMRLGNIEKHLKKKEKQLMDSIDRLTQVMNDLASDSADLADEVKVVVDLLKELSTRNNDAEIEEIAGKLEIISEAFDATTKVLSDAADEAAASGGPAT